MKERNVSQEGREAMNGPFEALKGSALYKHPEHSIASAWLSGFEYPWEALSSLSDAIRQMGRALPTDAFDLVGEDIWIAKTAKVAPTAFIGGPCIICGEAEIRHCAFIRGSAIVGAGAVVGNSTELKNCILLNSAISLRFLKVTLVFKSVSPPTTLPKR